MNRAGDFLRFLLIEEEMLADTAAERTGLSVDEVGALIAGTQPVTPEIAAKLSRLAGTSPQLWLKLQDEG